MLGGCRRPGSIRLDVLPNRGDVCGQEEAVPHLSPTTRTTDGQRLILRATARNVRDHTIISLALGTRWRAVPVDGAAIRDGGSFTAGGRASSR